MRIHKIKVLLVLFFISCIVNGSAQIGIDSVNIKISVFDSINKATLEYCTIDLLNKENNTVQMRYLTNDKGVVLMPISKMSYPNICIISRIGYMSDTIQIQDFTLLEYNIFLTPVIGSLENINITAHHISRDVDKLTYKLGNKFSENTSVFKVLQKVPLLSVTNNNDIKIKGNTPATIYVNGKLVSSEFIKTLTSDKIKEIEVVTNPSVEYDPNKVLGIVNIILKKQTQNQFNGRVTIIDANDDKLFFPGVNFSVLSKKIYFNISSSMQKSTQKNNRIIDRFNIANQLLMTDTSNRTSKLRANSINTSVFYEIDSTNEIYTSIDFSYYNTRSGAITNGNYISPFSSFINLGNYKNKMYSIPVTVGYKKKFSKKAGMKVEYENSYTNSRSSSFADILVANRKKINFLNNDTSTYNSNAFQVVYYNSLFNKKLYTEIGFSYANSKNEKKLGNYNFDEINNQLVYDINNSGKLNYELKNLSTFINTKFKIGSYNTRLGMRFDNKYFKTTVKELQFLNTESYNILYPNIAISKKLNKKTQLLFNYRKRIKLPDFSIVNPFTIKYGITDEYIGNSKLKPTSFNKFTLALDIQNNKSFWEIEPYLEYSKRALVYVASTTDSLIKYEYKNLKHLLVKGVSFSNNNELSETVQLNTSAFIEHYNYSNEYGASEIYKGLNYGFTFYASKEFEKLFTVSIDASVVRKSYEYQSYDLQYPSLSFSLERNFLKDKLYVSVSWGSILDTWLKSKSVYNDGAIRQVSLSNSDLNSFSLMVAYSFGKYFWSSKSKTGISKDENVSMQQK